jgi:cytoskeletal protein RodZ
VDENQLEIPIVGQARKASLGQFLVAARKQRGLSRETVVQQTHIPALYVQMLEDDDYRRISDELYLLPFLRKYAIFLDIDQDETAMLLLREVQLVENNPSTVRLSEPLGAVRRSRPRNWMKPIMFGALIAVIVSAYIVQSRRSDTDTVTAPKLQSSRDLIAPSSSFASNETLHATSLVQAASPSVRESNSGAGH